MKLKEIREQNGCGNSCGKCDFSTSCSDCEKKICSLYDEDYRNIDDTTETLCGECYQLKKSWDKTVGDDSNIQNKTTSNDLMNAINPSD